MGKSCCRATGEAIGETYGVAAQTTALCDAWFEGTDAGCGVEGCACVAMRAQELAREFGVSRVVLALAGREGFPVPREGEGLTGKRTRKSYVPNAATMGPLLRARQLAMGGPLTRVRTVLPHASLVSGWCSRTLNARVWEPAACRQTSCGLSPIEADEGRKRNP